MYNVICKTLENQPLNTYSSMKTGGNAKLLLLPTSIDELKRAVLQLRKDNKKYIILGNLSNVIVPDTGLDVAVIITTNVKDFSVTALNSEKTLVYSACGIQLSRLALDMCKRGLSGLEFAYGIPGTVGGAAFMNAGAYGGELCDVVESIDVLDKDGNVVKRTREECQFGYRTSVFQKNNDVVLGASLVLTKKAADECVTIAKDFMSRRIDKQPLEYPSCGSTFVRPVGYFAGKLIEDAGLKGFAVGGACVSEKHAGFVINKDNATTDDVLNLMRQVRQKVLQNSGVTLEPEIRILDNNGEICSL